MSSRFVYLASRSPRRRELLEQLGVDYRTLPADIDESRRDDESPRNFVARMASDKARAVRMTLRADDPAPVLGADTIVVIDDEVLGKPHDERDANAMLMRLSGRAHEVLTAVALLCGGVETARLNTSRVWFRELNASERHSYCATGESLDKAGAYAIQGRAAAFIERLEGSYSGVMGLPLFETAELLSRAGMDVTATDHCMSGT